MSVLTTVAAFLNKPQASIGSQTNSALSVLLDASVNETHTSSAEVTSHPVENAPNITDHVHRQPDTITIEGLISNTSTKFPEGTVGIALIRSVANLVGGVSNDLAKTAYDQLRQLVEGKELIKIVTTLREYDNMLLENLTVRRNADYGDALNFTVTARQIRIVQTASVAALEIGTSSTPITSPKEPTKAASKALGTKSKQNIPAAQVPEESFFLQAKNGLVSLFK